MLIESQNKVKKYTPRSLFLKACLTCLNFKIILELIKNIDFYCIKNYHKNYFSCLQTFLDTLSNVVSLRNGQNNLLMLKESILGMGILNHEGIYTKTLLASNIICQNPIDAIKYFKNQGDLSLLWENNKIRPQINICDLNFLF